MRQLRIIAVVASVALHGGLAAGLILVSQSAIDQVGGDTPIEISLDPSAASGGNGPPIDAGPSQPPAQAAESPPQEVPKTSEETPKETTPPKEEKPREEPPKTAETTPPQEEKPAEEPPKTTEAPPPEEKKPDQEPPKTTEVAPPEEKKPDEPETADSPTPPVIKSAPDSDTPEVVATEPPPPPPPKPEQPKPKPKPLPPKPKPPPQQAISGGTSGGAQATGRVRTQRAGTAIERGAQMTCASGVRSRLRHPSGSPPRPFYVVIKVTPSGALLRASLQGTSGVPALDQAALRSVRNSAPFPPCPGIGAGLELRIPFR